MQPQIDWGLCQSCTPCLARKACKTQALVQIEPGDPPYIDPSRCSLCAVCITACCCNAISLNPQNSGLNTPSKRS